MKQKLFLMCLVGLLSVTSAYAKCDGGTEVTNTVGTTFCKSNVYMNWWSAAAWCRANGLHLATIYEMCPSWDGNANYGRCPELEGKGSEYLWSATAFGVDGAIRLQLSQGYVNKNSRIDSTAEYHAFCR